MSQCAALTKALASKGYDSTRLATETHIPTDRVQSILAGGVKPTQQEFSAIAGALGLSSAPKHAAEVTV